MKIDEKQSDSSPSTTLDILGDKWNLLILRDMLFEGKSSFSEFKASKEKIASNILTARLVKLDSEGYIIKTASPSNKVKYLYSLSDKAIDLLPVFVEIFSWEQRQAIEPHCTNPALKKLKANNSVTIAQYAGELKQRRATILGF